MVADMILPVGQHPLRRDRDKSKESHHERDRSVEMKESLLSQALEGGPTLTVTPQVTQTSVSTFPSHQ